MATTRFQGVSLAAVTDPAVRRVLEQIVQHLDAQSAGVLGSQWSESAALTLATSHADVYTAAGSAGLPVVINFHGAKRFAVNVQWNYAGTGVQEIRGIAGGPAGSNVLFTLTGLQSGDNELPARKVPLWARDRLISIKLQAKSTVDGDLPTFRGCVIRMD